MDPRRAGIEGFVARLAVFAGGTDSLIWFVGIHSPGGIASPLTSDPLVSDINKLFGDVQISGRCHRNLKVSRSEVAIDETSREILGGLEISCGFNFR